MLTARFDDLRPRHRRSFALSQPEQTLIATRPDQVITVLQQAEAAVRNGKWVGGFVSYEAAPAFDSALEVNPTGDTALADLPLAWFAVFPSRSPAEELPGHPYTLGRWQPEVDEGTYRERVAQIREEIRAGETYQVNHTFRLHASFEGDAASLYRDLARSQTCGYGAFINTGRWAIASASPELFFEWRSGAITCKPMKGTAPRGVRLPDDEARRRSLVTSEKDRAENLMIVDMVRNDLGRIARLGSVQVPELFSAEKYDTVWQLTSTVAAEPRPGTGLVDVFSSLFPCASITGAPKVATMRIIRRMEQTPRGVYCGAVGFGGPGRGGEPEWAFNVAIRTVLVDTETGHAVYGTGGGITFDSTPEGEHAEALLKAQVLSRRSAHFELLETIRYQPGAGFHLLDRHLARLAESAHYFDVPLDLAEVRAVLRTAVSGRTRPARVRLLVGRDGRIRQETDDLPPRPPRPLRLVIDDQGVDPADVFVHHKTTNRRIYQEAAARHPEADDVILTNQRGDVTETTVGNLAVLIDGNWCTPPLESGCLAGTERAELLANGELIERPITIAEAQAAPAVARINSVRGWEPGVVLQPVKP